MYSAWARSRLFLCVVYFKKALLSVVFFWKTCCIGLEIWTGPCGNNLCVSNTEPIMKTCNVVLTFMSVDEIL